MSGHKAVNEPVPLNPRAQQTADAIDRVVLRFATHWLSALIGFGTVLLTLATLAPVLQAAGHGRMARPIYLTYRLICHQRSDRSFHIADEKMAFCERDLAIVVAGIVTAIVYGLVRQRTDLLAIRFRWVVLFALPMALDGTTQLIGLRESTWELRVLTGTLFSAGVGWFILPHLDRGFRDVATDIALRLRPAAARVVA